VFLFLSVNNGGDALARVGATAQWLQHPSLKFFFGRYLPLHFWLIGGLTFLLHDVSLAGRSLSLVLGTASLGLFWRLAWELYRTRAANLSLLVFSLYSLHIAYSTTSSSEVPYLFFVLLGLVCFFAYRRSGSVWLLALAGIGLTVAAAIRYEAWVIIFSITLLLLHSLWQTLQQGPWRMRHLGPVVLFGATGGAWPAFWMFFVWAKMGHPFYFVNEQGASVLEQLAFAQRSTWYLLGLSPGVLLLTLSPVVIAAILYALWLAIHEGAGREFFTVLIIVALVQFYEIVSGGLLPLARYTLTLGTLLAALSGHGLERLAHRFFPRAMNGFRMVVLATLVLNLATILVLSETQNRYSEKLGSISPRLRFPHQIEDVGKYLRPRLGPDDAVVIDNYNDDSNIVAAAAGLPLLPGDRAYLARSQTCSALESYIKAKHPGYLVYSDSGTLRPCLPLPQGRSTPTSFAGMEFRCVLENETYRVYEIKYQ